MSKCVECNNPIVNDLSPCKTRKYCNDPCKYKHLNRRHDKAHREVQQKLRGDRANELGVKLQKCDICGYKFVNLNFHKKRSHGD